MEDEKAKLCSLDSGDSVMAKENCMKRLRDEGTCSICLDYFTNPVTLDCGHNFCYNCIAKSRWLSPRKTTCPQCRGRVWVKKLRPNSQLANMVEIAKDLSSLLKHHGTFSVEEADQEFAKDQINRSLKILRKERENILVYKAESEKESQNLLKQMEAEREKTTATFRDLHQFLEEQEKLLLAQMEEVEKEIERKRDEHIVRLSGELSSLDSLIQEVKEKQKQPKSELLQNSADILERCKKVSFENPVAFPAALKWKIHDFHDINPFLKGIIKHFKDFLVSGLELQDANVTLDPDTAHPRLILSEDCKSVRCEYGDQDLPDNPERFDCCLYVLGREGFTTGRHFWEVAVGQEKDWVVGVARKSIRRKGKYDATPKDGMLGMGIWNGEYRASLPPDDPPLSPSQELKKIRVMLNCAGGQVAFFDADTGALLCEYLDPSLYGEMILPFFYVSERCNLTICPCATQRE